MCEAGKEMSCSPGGNVWVRLQGRGGKRSRSAVKGVGGKSDQMRGKVKTGRRVDDSFVSES